MPENPSVPTPDKDMNTVPESSTPPASEVPTVPVETIPVPVAAATESPAKVSTVKAEPEKEDTPIAEGSEKPKRSATQILIGFIAILLGLVAVAYVFILWSLVEGNFSDPQFAQFLDMVGMKPTELKEKFTLITHILFGGFSFIFLIATLVKFFQWMMTAASSVYKKTHIKKWGYFS